MRQEAAIVRIEEPIHHLPLWLVTRYPDIMEVLRDPRLTKDVRNLTRGQGSHQSRSPLDALTRHMLSTDPPSHTRLRSLVSQAFTPRRIESLRARVHTIASELLDNALAESRVDFVSAYALPLPLIVITELLGVPAEDRNRFHAWTQAMVTPRGDTLTAGLAFIDYLQQLLTKHRAHPGEDLVSALLEAEEQSDTLSGEELMATTFLLLGAGHETTVSLLSGGLLALLQNPEQYERLHDDGALLPGAVEEMLRYCSPSEMTSARFPVDDIVVCGQLVPAGEMVLASLMSANHDPAVFPEPERFDVGRTPNKHVAFGLGSHHCLGASLARLEAMVTFELLLERARQPRLAVEPEYLAWREGTLLRGLQALPVVL
ncbi:cytochrome P450 [Cystobacter fuscus]|nr:cytochrome P450 [Cystobacter fuscus]